MESSLFFIWFILSTNQTKGIDVCWYLHGWHHSWWKNRFCFWSKRYYGKIMVILFFIKPDRIWGQILFKRRGLMYNPSWSLFHFGGPHIQNMQPSSNGLKLMSYDESMVQIQKKVQIWVLHWHVFQGFVRNFNVQPNLSLRYMRCHVNLAWQCCMYLPKISQINMPKYTLWLKEYA